MAAIMSLPQCVEEDGLSDLAKYCATYTSIISLKCTDTSELLYLLSIHETLLLCQIEDLQRCVYLATRLKLDAVIYAHHMALTTNHLEIHKQQGTESIQIYLTSIGNPIVEIRQSYNRLISTMGFHILVRWHLYTESGGKQTYQTSILLNKKFSKWRSNWDCIIVFGLRNYISFALFKTKYTKGINIPQITNIDPHLRDTANHGYVRFN